VELQGNILFIEINTLLKNHEILAQNYQNIGPIGPIKIEAGRLNVVTNNLGAMIENFVPGIHDTL